MHLDAVEHGKTVVFLHAVEPGPASQSYGLHVAALAGMPPAVLREAQRRLVELESRAIAASTQPDLFGAVTPELTFTPLHPAVEALQELDPDALSPREALDRLYALKRLLED